MNDKLYYKDSYQQKCTARIISQKTDDKGLWLQLDQNIFYPGGGGQLPDKGQIAGNDLKTIMEDEGIIWYCIEKNNSINEGDKVQVEIDWPTRYQNMQQHSGQHLLSHVLWERGLKTISVHLGEKYTLIEIEGDFPDNNLIQTIEDDANHLIRKAIPINSFTADRKKAAALPLRKPAGDWDELRIVEINGMDFSACGGTHVNNTSEIGLIKHVGSEKIRGHARLKFVIGKSAYTYFNQLHYITNRIKDTLQTDPAQFPEKLNALVDDLSTSKKENNQLKKYYIQFMCSEILHTNNQEYDIIVHEFSDGTIDDIKDISRQLASEHGKISFIYGNGRFCICSPDDSDFNTSTFMREQGSNLALKGGGPEGFVQGIYTHINIDDLVKTLKKYHNK